MTTEPDITVTIIFHHEGAFAVPALASLRDLSDAARAAGQTVETQAILDRADDLTRHIVDVRGDWLDAVEEVSFGDLGLSRNAGTQRAHGRYLSFLDGDDLWGERWLQAAFAAASSAPGPEAIWHPEHLYVFREAEFGDGTGAGTQAFYTRMHASDTPGFEPLLLAFGNLWSANVFAARELHLRFPYRAADRAAGLGIEDWSWNLETLGAGIHHRVVHDAVHLIRRGGASLDRQNTEEGLLPSLPSSLVWGTPWP